MNVALLSLCKELYELSGWFDTDYVWVRFSNDPMRGAALVRADSPELGHDIYRIAGAYNLDYLLRNLPKNVTEFWGQAYPASPCLMYTGTQWLAFYQSTMTSEHNTDELFGQFADTPEDAAAMLAIELFKQGVLKHE
jgi:hypothetical protein